MAGNRMAVVGPYQCGQGAPLLWVAGPCVLEDTAAAIEIATELKRVADQLDVSFVFKASFDKANRTSIHAPRGPGLTAGLAMLSEVQDAVG